MEIIRFTLFSRHVVFDGEGDKLRNKRIENHITVLVVIDMECGNTKNLISNNRQSRILSQKACGFFFAQKQKGGIREMAVFRVEKNSGYTVMSNHHLRNRALSLKAKGLLSQMLSLPEDWDYTLQGLARINRESIDAIRQAIREL